MKIMITGDSHTGALKLGWDYLISQGDLPQGYQIDIQALGGGNTLTKPFFADRGDFAEMTHKKHQKRITRLPLFGDEKDDEKDYEYYGICGPLHTTRLWRHKSNWRRYTPFTPKDNRAPISTSLLRHVVLQDQRYIMKLIELLKHAGVKVFVIEAPRPFKHHPALELANHEIVHYIDEFYRKVIGEWLASKEVPVIDVPKACYDADGFMDETFRNDNQEDGHHANKEFGAIMIKRIIEFLKSQN